MLSPPGSPAGMCPHMQVSVCNSAWVFRGVSVHGTVGITFALLEDDNTHSRFPRDWGGGKENTAGPSWCWP